MRSDMAKVIVERPRYGSRTHGKPKGYRRRLQRYGDESPPAFEGIKKRSFGGDKRFSERLGPLRRFLESQVGRPWDKVIAEICVHINRDSAVQDHVRDHIKDFVVARVLVIDGILCDGTSGYWFGQPLHDRMPWRMLYVCPRTGLLKRLKPIRKQVAAEHAKKPDFVRVSDTEVCKFLAGAWQLVTVKSLPEVRQNCHERDIVLNRAVADLEPCFAVHHYGATVYAVAIRRLSQREIRQLPIPVDCWE